MANVGDDLRRCRQGAVSTDVGESDDTGDLHPVERLPCRVRIRHSTLDVRLPLDVDAQGVRLWSAPYQAMFPLNAGAVARVFALWQLRRPRLTRARYDVDTFLNDIVAPHADLDAVDIVEERHLVFIDSCAVEVSDVWFDGYPLRTLAISMSDRERVVKTVRGLGLSGCQSVDYVQALKRYLAIRGTEWRVAQREAYTRQNVSRGASEVM